MVTKKKPATPQEHPPVVIRPKPGPMIIQPGTDADRKKKSKR